MSESLRILMLEDNPVDAELNERALRAGGLTFQSLRVERRDEFVASLTDFEPDLVLADHRLPQFDGLSALSIVREVRSLLPFIFVTGAMGEVQMIEGLRRGASDHVLKDHLGRLPEAVDRAIEKVRASQRLEEVQRQLVVSETRFRGLVETSSDWIWELDGEGRFSYSSPRVIDMLGYTPEQVLGRRPVEFIEAGSASRMGELFTDFAMTGRPFELVEANFLNHDGHLKVLELSGRPRLSSSGCYCGHNCSARDITERMRYQVEVAERATQIALLFERNATGIMVVDGAGIVQEANPAAALLLGRSIEELSGMSFGTPTTLGDETDLVIHVPGGETRSISMTHAETHWSGMPAYVFSLQDITERKKQQERLALIAHQDALTGLPNRLILGDRLCQAIAANRRAGTWVAVCYLDLDGFKEVNDSFGHQTGDTLLVEVARRMSSLMRGGDTVARLGGDEFVMLIGGVRSIEECQKAIDRLCRAISEPYTLQGREYSGVSASIGVTIHPNDDADPDTLIRHADHAMYAAKQEGKNRMSFFDAPMERMLAARNTTLQRLETALHDDELVLHFQPKVDFRSERVCGFEALIRWKHPTLGLLGPAEFLPLIEEDALASAVGTWVLEEALRHAALWKAERLDSQVCVNVFARQLIEPEFVQQLAALLRTLPPLSPNNLQIELVETGALREVRVVRGVIEQCRELGVDFALDDFGTGYSTLSYLRQLPAREIKIDQSFVRNMLIDKDDQTIVEAVIALGGAFRMQVVAEGAETPEHVRSLLELGCNVMQGYAIARPMPGSEVMDWVNNFRFEPRWKNGSFGPAETAHSSKRIAHDQA